MPITFTKKRTVSRGNLHWLSPAFAPEPDLVGILTYDEHYFVGAAWTTEKGVISAIEEVKRDGQPRGILQTHFWKLVKGARGTVFVCKRHHVPFHEPLDDVDVDVWREEILQRILESGVVLTLTTTLGGFHDPRLGYLVEVGKAHGD